MPKTSKLITNPHGQVPNPNAKILSPASTTTRFIHNGTATVGVEHGQRLSRNDVEMVPDRGFVRQLKCLDPEFEVVWDRGSYRWQIWRFPKDGKPPLHQITVQTKDRSYRELGADILIRLQKADPWRFNSKADLYAYFEEMDNQIRRRKMNEFVDKIKSIALDTFSYAQQIPYIAVPRKYKIGSVVKNG